MWKEDKDRRKGRQKSKGGQLVAEREKEVGEEGKGGGREKKGK